MPQCALPCRAGVSAMAALRSVMTAGERQAIETSKAALTEIALANPALLTGGDPLALVALHVENIGHSAAIEVITILLQRFCGTVASRTGAALLEPLAATVKQLAEPALARLDTCVARHKTFQSAFSLTPLLNRMAALATQCCAVAVRDITSAASVLPLVGALKMLSDVLTTAVVDRVEHFRPLDSGRLASSYDAFAIHQAELSLVLAAELLGAPEPKRKLAPALARPGHGWRNDELRQFWEARCATKYDAAVPIDALAVLLLRATGVEASLNNREAVMRRLTAIKHQDQARALISAPELDSCASEVRRCGGLRAWVHAVLCEGGPEVPGVGPLGTTRLAGGVPSLASTWGSMANSWRGGSLNNTARSDGATPRGVMSTPFALTSSSLKSARSARSDNGQGQALFDTVERHLLKTSRQLIFGERLPVNARHIAFRDTPLHTAAAQDQRHAPHCTLLLDHGADCNAEDRHLATPLHVAAGAGQGEAAKKLIKCGANVCKEDRWRGTPLHRAAQNGQTELAELLLRSGAACGTVDEWGSTPLHRAVAKCQLAVAEQLLSNSAGRDAVGANAEDRAGNRPLHLAARNGDYAMVRLLVECNVDTTARSRVTGKTPEEYASERGHSSVVALLQNGDEWVCKRQPTVAPVA